MNPKDKKTILSKGATFDEPSMMKPTDSQQVESKKTTMVSQQQESDATPSTLGSSILFEISLTVTQDENHVADENTEDIENQRQVMGKVQDYVAAGQGRRNSQKPAWLTANMNVTYTLSVIEDAIPSTYREVEISYELEMWKEAMLEG